MDEMNLHPLRNQQGLPVGELWLSVGRLPSVEPSVIPLRGTDFCLVSFCLGEGCLDFKGFFKFESLGKSQC